MISLVDSRGERVTLRSPAARIVSLVPSQTELLASLNLDEEVVGLTRFCVRPDRWAHPKQIVGGTKTLRIDRVRDLKPDLILANLEENTKEDVLALEAIAPVFVTNIGTLEDAELMIDNISRLTGRSREGTALLAAIESEFAALPLYQPIRAAYLIWESPLMTVGGDTFICDVMRRGGLQNAFDRQSRYPEICDADLVDAQIDVLLLPDEPFPFNERHASYFRKLLRGAAVIHVDGQIFSWYGSRLVHAPSQLRDIRSFLGV